LPLKLWLQSWLVWPIAGCASAAPFLDRGAEFYDAQHRKLQINYLQRKAANLGFQINEASAASLLERCRLTTTASIQLVILTLKFRLEVFFASSCFADFGVFADVCGGSSLPGTG
jgi:hypothetical protein